MKGFRGTYLFAILVVGFSIYTYFFEYQKGIEEEIEKKELAKVFSYIKEVAVVTLQNGDQTITLEKIDGTWHMTSPVKDKANQSAAEAFANGMLMVKTEEEVEEGEGLDWSMYGIDKSVVSVTVKGKNGKEVTVQSGTQKSYDEGYYVSVKGSNKVILINPTWAGLIVKSVSEFRNKFIYREDLGEVSGIKIENRFSGHKEDIELKKEKDTWKLIGSSGYKIDPESVKEFLKNLKALEGTGFAGEDKDDKPTREKFGLGETQAKVTLSFAKKETPPWEALVYSGKGSGGYLTVSNHNAIFRVRNKKLEEFKRVADDFRDRREAFVMDEKNVKEIFVKSPSGNLEIAKKDGGWKLKVPVEKKVLDETKVDDMLTQMGAMAVTMFLGKVRGKGLRPPKNQLLFKNKKGETILDLRWGKKFKKKPTVRAKEEHEMFYVSTNQLKETLGVSVSLLDSLQVNQLTKDQEKKPKEPNPSKKPPNKPSAKSGPSKTEPKTDG